MESPPKPIRRLQLSGSLADTSDSVSLSIPQSYVITMPFVAPVKQHDPVLPENSNSQQTVMTSGTEPLWLTIVVPVGESVGVDRILDRVLSLPQVVSEVAVQHQDQTNALSTAQTILQHNKSKFEDEQEKLFQVKAELCGLKKRLYLLTETTSSLKANNASIDKGINRMYTNMSDLRLKKEMLIEKNQTMQTLNENYIQKIQAHVSLVAELEKDSEICIEVARQRELVSHLKEQKFKMAANPGAGECVLDGTKETDCNERIVALKVKQSELESLKQLKEEELTQTQDTKRKLQQEVEVLHKRNNAHLTRMKRQVSEKQLRNRQWSNQRNQLESAVSELRQKLNWSVS